MSIVPHHPPLALPAAGVQPLPAWSIAASIDGVILGESPVWSCSNQCLYWLDIDGRRIHRTQGGMTDTIQLTSIPGSLGLVDGHPEWIWIGTDEGIRILDWSSLQSCIVAPSPLPRTHRFNDGKVTPSGDLIIGSIVTESDPKKRQGAGALWRIGLPRTPKEKIRTQRLIDGATTPNGLDFDPTSERMWWIDTSLKRVDSLNITDDGCIDRRVAFTTTNLRSSDGVPINGDPDGMTRDMDGFIWVVMASGSHVCRFSPSGELVRSIHFPVTKVTSCCFGGREMRDLYVTSASKGVDREKEPLAGAVFVVPGVGRGCTMNSLGGDFFALRAAFSHREFGLTRHQMSKEHSTPMQLRAKL